MSELRHTIDLFERLYRELPPLTPKELSSGILSTLERLRKEETLSAEEAEALIVSAARHIWPYRRAFDDFFAAEERLLGDLFLSRLMDRALRARYEEFVAYGGAYHDLSSGGVTAFFAPDEVRQLAALLIRVRNDIRRLVHQRVLSTDRRRYEAKVRTLQAELEELEILAHGLRERLQKETHHQHIVQDIRERLYAYEYGLSGLGPYVDPSVIRRAALDLDTYKRSQGL